MTARRRYMALGSFGVLAGAAVVANPAWACSANAKIETAAVSAPAGGVVTVNGLGFNGPTTDGPVEIRWNSLSGTPIASSTAGASFSVQVPIPTSAAPGFYFITAVQRSTADGKISWKSSVPIEVVGSQTPTEPIGAGPVVEESVDSGTVEEPVDSGTIEEPVGSGTVQEPVGSGTVEEQVGSDPVREPVGADSSVPAGSPTVVATPASAGVNRLKTPQRSSVGGGFARPLSPPGAVVGAFRGGSAVPGSVAGLPGPANAGDLGLAQAPTNPAAVWTQPTSSKPAPSLFEPVEGAESHGAAGAPIGVGMVTLGLLATAGAGVVAGQRRRLLASRSTS